MEIKHQPILLDEIIDFFQIQSHSLIVDATTGEGGHSSAFSQLNPQGRLICLDRNTDILDVARQRMHDRKNVSFVNTTFSHIREALDQQNIQSVDAILADLGISMFHLKNSGLGFSFEDDESLDMRLDGEGVSARDVVNQYPEQEIADILYKYGEEHESRRIAHSIVAHRPYNSSKELALAIVKGKKNAHARIHAATKSFQALRIYVNREWEELEAFIPAALGCLKEGGRLGIISFHSLEDRIVKWKFRELAQQQAGIIVTKKPCIAGPDELNRNPAARSAKLRIFEKRTMNEEF